MASFVVLEDGGAGTKVHRGSLGSVGKVSYGLQKFPANRPTSHPRPYLRVANVQRYRLDLRDHQDNQCAGRRHAEIPA